MRETLSSHLFESPEMASVPDEIDLRETDPSLVGFSYLEERYGHDPNHLSQNAALALMLLLEETEHTLVVGKGASLLGQNSQEFLDNIVDSLCATEKKAGYARLFEAFVTNIGGTPEFTMEQLSALKDKKNWLLDNFSNLRPEERMARQQDLKLSELSVLNLATAKYLNGVLQETTLLHEQGQLENIDPDLFYEYCGQFLPLEIDGQVITKARPIGLDDDVYGRLVREAHYIYRADTGAVLV